MLDHAKHLVLSGLDRVLLARGIAEDEVPLARDDVIAWARVRARAARGRRGSSAASASS